MSVEGFPGEVVGLAEQNHGFCFRRVAQGVLQMVEIEGESAFSRQLQKMNRHPAGAGGAQVMFRGWHRNICLRDAQGGWQQEKQFG